MVVFEVLMKLTHLLIPRNQAQDVGGREGEGHIGEDDRETKRGLLSFEGKEFIFFPDVLWCGFFTVCIILPITNFI